MDITKLILHTEVRVFKRICTLLFYDVVLFCLVEEVEGFMSGIGKEKMVLYPLMVCDVLLI